MKDYKEFGGTFFAGFFASFFLGQGEKYTGKKLAETQSMKTQVKSGEIPVRKNFEKIMQNLDSRRLTPKSAKLTCYPIPKIQSRKNMGKDLKISKNRYGRQLGSRTNKKNI